MRTSETIDALSKALAAAQGEMENATLNRVNPHFKSKYADLAAIRDAVLPALSKNGLAVTQVTDFDGESFRLVTRLMHGDSGQWIEGVYPLTAAANPQAMGSQLTYARRYSLSAIAGISADEDDDAELATASKNGAALITDDQVKTIQQRVVATGADLPRFLKYMKVERVEDITTNRYQAALDALAAKAKEAA